MVDLDIAIVCGIFLSLIHVLSCAASYLLFKYLWTRDFNSWTKADRAFFVLISTLGVISLISAIVIYVRETQFSNESAGW